MPTKYHIHVQPAPARFAPVPKFSMIEKDGCLGCLNCIKDQCVYGVYEERSFDPQQMIDTIDTLCMSCLRCIQGCKKRLFTRALNPDFARIGNDYWTPDLIADLWGQAATGKIPVSGAGYGGPFAGPGFDAMWTDMSEIVRPTRDGIHGREYISTAIDLGRKPFHLEFDEQGRLVTEPPPLVEIPIPLLFQKPPAPIVNENVQRAIMGAAHAIGTWAFWPAEEIGDDWHPPDAPLIPRLPAGQALAEAKKWVGWPLVALPYEANGAVDLPRLRQRLAGGILMVEVPLNRAAERIVEELTRAGAEVIHLRADWCGNEWEKEAPRFVKDALRSVHDRLVERGLRDAVTLLVSGGIALAEHVPKALICGADAVVIDWPLLIALECRLCERCLPSEERDYEHTALRRDYERGCPVAVDQIDPAWGARRIGNLMSAWHAQLLEVLGAMGLREAARLRGEVGRALFFEELEEETFGRGFGQVAR